MLVVVLVEVLLQNHRLKYSIVVTAVVVLTFARHVCIVFKITSMILYMSIVNINVKEKAKTLIVLMYEKSDGLF